MSHCRNVKQFSPAFWLPITTLTRAAALLQKYKMGLLAGMLRVYTVYELLSSWPGPPAYYILCILCRAGGLYAHRWAEWGLERVGPGFNSHGFHTLQSITENVRNLKENVFERNNLASAV